MSDDWKPGDQAQCINNKAWFNDGVAGPSLLNIYTVKAVRRYPTSLPGRLRVGLKFAEFPHMLYCHTCFRKPQPLKPDPVERVQMRESVHG